MNIDWRDISECAVEKTTMLTNQRDDPAADAYDERLA